MSTVREVLRSSSHSCFASPGDGDERGPRAAAPAALLRDHCGRKPEEGQPAMTGKNSRAPQPRRTRMPQAPAWFRRVPRRSSQNAWPSARVRRLVFARAFGFCESCGTSVIGRPYSIQPRAEQGTGETCRPRPNAVWNLSLLCGSATSPGGCYLLCEQRDQDMHDRGIWLRSWENPRFVPLWLFNPEGPRTRAWLNDDGTYDLEAPVAVTARVCTSDARSGSLSAARQGQETRWRGGGRMSVASEC
jgi:hypothetical protein